MSRPVQPMLPCLPADSAGQVIRAEYHGQPSAELILSRDPDRYRRAVSLRRNGMGQHAIATELGMSVHTVRAILRHAGAALFAPEQDNQRAISLFREGRELALERTIEALSDDTRSRKMTPDKLALTAAILTDKAQLLSGEATQRIEHTHDTVPAAEEFAAFMHAGVIDVESQETGIEAGGAGQRALTAPSDQGDPAGAPVDQDADAAAAAVIGGNAVHKSNDQVGECESSNDLRVSGAHDVSDDVSGATPGALAGPAGVDPAGRGAGPGAAAQAGGEGVDRDAAAAT